MADRVLVLSDVHEHDAGLMRLVDQAECTSGGIQEIWLLGDLLGPIERDAELMSPLDEKLMIALSSISTIPIRAVVGNWEHWLLHPEMDEVNPNQQKYAPLLRKRRDELGEERLAVVAEVFDAVTLEYPKNDALFTLFHGCSYACHDSKQYHAAPWESYLKPKDLNIVTRGLFIDAEHLKTPHFLFGHTHQPGWFVYSKTTYVNAWIPLTLEKIGQPISFYGTGVQRFGINPGTAASPINGALCTGIILDFMEKTFCYVEDRPQALFFNQWQIAPHQTSAKKVMRQPINESSEMTRLDEKRG